MTVRELIEELSKMDQDRLVVLQTDEEGNGYHKARGVDDNCGYSMGEVGHLKLTEEDIKAGYAEEDLAEEGSIPCVVIFP